MRLDEAITMAMEMAERQEECGGNDCMGCVGCADDHRQLAEWLLELMRFREQARREKYKMISGEDSCKKCEDNEEPLNPDGEEKIRE